MEKLCLFFSFVIAGLSPFTKGLAQQGYEFEVYDTHLTKPGTTEFEMNANFVVSGRKQVQDGLFATHHMWRSSFEVGTGITDWLEASVYLLAARREGLGTSYVGNRVRATASVPAEWNLPFEIGLTQEIGYARPGFAESRWTYELSPMVGKTWRSLAFVANPAFERSLGDPINHPIEFEPRGRISYGFADKGSLSLEYYSSLGPASRFDPVAGQKHQLFLAMEKDLWTRWELAASCGRGLTNSSDRFVMSTRIEYLIGR